MAQKSQPYQFGKDESIAHQFYQRCHRVDIVKRVGCL